MMCLDAIGLLTYNICRMSELVEHISKKKIPDHQKNVIFEITAEDETEEDVEVPYVMLKLRK
jgi:ubiquitin-activating enzyme E1